MEIKNEVDIEIPDEQNLEGLDDTTDWKGKASELQKLHREAGIRNRERTKALKDKITDLEKNSQKLPEKIEKKSDEFGLLEKTYLASMVKVIDEEEVKLAEKGWNEYKKFGGTFESYVQHPIFTGQLEAHRTAKANADATSNIRGGAGGTETKNTPGYWLAKGTPPTAEQVPDKKTRVKIYRAMMTQKESGGKFYNE